MLVECYDEKGAEVYEMIIKQIFQDLVLGPAVEDLKAFANPDEAVFILAIKMKKTSGVIKFGDVANFTYDKNNNVTSKVEGPSDQNADLIKTIKDLDGDIASYKVICAKLDAALAVLQLTIEANTANRDRLLKLIKELHQKYF